MDVKNLGTERKDTLNLEFHNGMFLSSSIIVIVVIVDIPGPYNLPALDTTSFPRFWLEGPSGQHPYMHLSLP